MTSARIYSNPCWSRLYDRRGQSLSINEQVSRSNPNFAGKKEWLCLTDRLDIPRQNAAHVIKISGARQRLVFCLCGGTTPTRGSLTFRELETFAGAGLSRFFSLFHARIAAKQTLSFEWSSQIGIDLQKRPRNGQLRRAGLSHDATAAGVDPQIVSVHSLGGLKRLQHHVL